MSASFVHLHVHTQYSLLESPIKIPDLIDQAVKANMPSLAITDNGTMYGIIQFYMHAKSKGIKPIIGCEMYLAENASVKERGWHRLILLCQNYTGYQNLIKLVTQANLDGFYYKPRTDFQTLKDHTEGLIAISPGLRGPIGYMLRQNEKEEAKALATAFKDAFQGEFYLGVQFLDQPMEDIINESSKELGEELGIPIVATNDVYYLAQKDAEIKDILGCIQTGKLLHEETRGRNLSDAHYFKSEAEMQATFAQYPEALENTLKIAQKCNLVIETEQVKLPHFECPDNLSAEDYLEKLVWEGIDKKYNEITDEIRARVKFELDVIKPMQYATYFLIIYDFLHYCTQSQIPTGPGRGSAAGSIVSYALDITKIDPLKYNLLFERFLNPERVSMPDIDLDFCIRRRSEVIDYIIAKYHKDHVSQIATFGTMASRGVIRDVGRVLDVPLREVDRIAKLIPSTPGQYCSIPEALETVPDLKKIYESSDEYKQLFDIAIQLEGVSRHTSIHAAGVVISRDPLASVVPLIRNDGQVATQFSMTDLEKVGLLKMDILGLRNLTVMEDAVALIHQKYGVMLDLNALPDDDVKTYDLLCSGNTMGIFQLEGRGMRALIKEMQPRVFEDIIAALALYRPGPLGSGMVSDFISNKLGKTTVKYDLPELESILKETYGLIVYQEQVMQIASVIGGFTLGQADMLRRAMGKKKKEEMDKLREEFLNGARQRNFPADKSKRIFELCYKFAEYGFNKSHSAAYALISYQTAYLKANYPVEYMVALLSSIFGSTDRVSLYIQECRQMGIPVLPPDINFSEKMFSIELTGETKDIPGIRFGLLAIKNVGEAAIENILKNREAGYKTLGELCSRCDNKQINKRVLENLIKSGACDSLGDRGELLGNYERLSDFAQSLARERENGQLGLFEGADPAQNLVLDPKHHVYISKGDRLKNEKALLGLYLSGHPLEEYQKQLEKMPRAIDTLTLEDEDSRVTLLGLICDTRKMITKTKKEMLVGTLEDMTGSIEIVVFQTKKYETIAPHFVDDAIVLIHARVRVSQEQVSLICDDLEPLHQNDAKKVYIDTENLENMEIYKTLRKVFMENRGGVPVILMVGDTKIQAHEKYRISGEEPVLLAIEKILGAGHYWVV